MNHYKIKKTRRGLLGILGSLSTVAWLIAINILIFIPTYFFFLIPNQYVEYIALESSNLMQGKFLWTLLTHMFVHAGFFHLFVNMFSLYFLGSLTEKIIGKKRFIWFFIIAGILAGLLTAYLSYTYGNTELGARIFGNPTVPMVGASGAIFGVLGILTMLIPKTKLSLIAGPLVVILCQYVLGAIIPNAASTINIISTMLIFLMLISMFSFTSRTKIALPITLPLWSAWIIAIIPLVILSIFVELPIGNVAHFGGFLAGIIYGLFLKMKYRRKVAKLQRMFR